MRYTICFTCKDSHGHWSDLETRIASVFVEYTVARGIKERSLREVFVDLNEGLIEAVGWVPMYNVSVAGLREFAEAMQALYMDVSQNRFDYSFHPWPWYFRNMLTRDLTALRSLLVVHIHAREQGYLPEPAAS